MEAVSFLFHFLSGHPAWPLASTLSCGARTFLSPLRGSDHLIHFMLDCRAPRYTIAL